MPLTSTIGFNVKFLEIKISSKFQDLTTRGAIIPIVEFGEKISSKFQDLTTHS